ncbi:hypothetical protein [Vulcanisaeta distributa]|uniref:hypothetical protein n=1 Tax=Vulcanisaeta distributa TaxID=164451 RepID=UPI0006D11A8C|nr:hypothetical protein [Vulcanisaeta distributa]
MDLIIYSPRIEASMPMLRNILMIVIKRYKSLSLPLPREFCRLAVLNPPREAIELLMRLGNSFMRLWGGWVPEFLREVMIVEPSAMIDCYDSIDRLRMSVDLGVSIARLIIKYRLSGRVDYDEWLGLFKEGVTSLVLPDGPVVVVDDYIQFIKNATKSNNSILLGPLMPMPIDLMVLISRGELGINYLSGVVNYVITYIGDYVVTSRDLTEAFIRLINDRGYISFIKSIGLPIIT